MIKIAQLEGGDPLRFDVTVAEDDGESRHEVTVGATDLARLTASGHSPTQLIEAAFRFLLDRESKESILRRFDLTVIARYFPEFEQLLPRYLSQISR